MRSISSKSTLRAAAVVVVVGALAAVGVGVASGQSSGLSPMQAAIAFDKHNVKPKRQYKIAFISVCATANPYCQKMVQGTRDAAKKYGVDLHLYDANFNPADQLKQVQDAMTQKWDGFILFPAQDALGCRLFHL